MDGNGVWRFPEGSGRQGRVERYCCNVICGAPTTSEVKGQRRDEKMRSYRIAHFCLFQTIDCCNPLAVPKCHWDFPIGMISLEC